MEDNYITYDEIVSKVKKTVDKLANTDIEGSAYSSSFQFQFQANDFEYPNKLYDELCSKFPSYTNNQVSAVVSYNIYRGFTNMNAHSIDLTVTVTIYPKRLFESMFRNNSN